MGLRCAGKRDEIPPANTPTQQETCVAGQCDYCARRWRNTATLFFVHHPVHLYLSLLFPISLGVPLSLPSFRYLLPVFSGA